ncbi:MAG: type II secretion system protein [Nitrospiraceae bacterium]|nr:type II secretion system protein [Nitrospiraceae bacterium]
MRDTTGGKQRVCVAGSRKGFTLLELLISFMLIGIVVAIMANALRLSFETVDRGEKKINSLERLRSSMSIINSQVQSHIPLTYDEQAEKKYYFKGEKGSLQFSSNYSIWGGEKGYVVVRYAVETDTGGKKFIAVTENVVGTETTRQTSLFNPLDDIYFEYFYKGPTDEKGGWVDAWKETASTPEKIRLHLVDNRRDLAIVIPMRVWASQDQPASAPNPANLWFDIKRGY